MVKIISRVAIGLGVTLLLTFLLVVVLAFFFAETLAPVVAIARDVLLVFMVLETTLILIALVILVAQLARLIVLLQSGARPILESAKDTAAYAQGTVQFLGKNLVEPVITATGFFTGVGALIRELLRIRRATRHGQAAEREPGK